MHPERPLRALIVDDEVQVRRRIGQLLEELGFRVAETGSAEDALVQLSSGVWDLVSLDVRLPGMSGLAALKEVSRLHPELPVIVLTWLPESQYAAAALRSGAAAFLNKERAPQELPAVVRRALEKR